MNIKKHIRIFNVISPLYNLFFSYQIREIERVMSNHLDKLNLAPGAKILEIGCGTGAYCHVLRERGYDVTGIDISPGMLKQAEKRGLNCRFGNVIDSLDFDDHSFDLVLSAYVAHGLDREKRKRLFEESARLTRDKVLISDYSSKRRPMISFIEYLEDGDYFHFIKNGTEEMKEFFKNLEVVTVTPFNNWYICKP